MFAPSTHAIAHERIAPDATSAMIAVVDSDDDCCDKVITMRDKHVNVTVKTNVDVYISIDFMLENVLRPI